MPEQMTTKQMLHAQVLSIVNDLEEPPTVLDDDPSIILENEDGYTYDEEEDEWSDSDGDLVSTSPMSGYDYLNDALDIEYTVNGKGEFLGGSVCVTFGGPNIYVNTRRNRVEGYWGGDTVTMSFDDNIGLDDALAELWEATK